VLRHCSSRSSLTRERGQTIGPIPVRGRGLGQRDVPSDRLAGHLHDGVERDQPKTGPADDPPIFDLGGSQIVERRKGLRQESLRLISSDHRDPSSIGLVSVEDSQRRARKARGEHSDVPKSASVRSGSGRTIFQSRGRCAYSASVDSSAR
jgi:hypothetical protein